MKKFFSLVVLFFVITTYGAVTVNVNGSNYSIPQTNERGWGTAVTSWIQAISSNTLQPVGGSFTLSNDVDFGPNFGLKTSYLLSRNTNPSSAGLLRLNVADSIGWRNNANNGNLLLGVNGSNQLTFNGSALLSSGNIVNADVSASAGIDASKIANGQISNAEFQALDGVSAPIVTTTGTQSLSNKDIDGGNASNSNRITIPKAAKTTLDALTRKQGTIVYDTTSNKPYYDDGANLKVIGSGSGGATNLIEDGDAESGFSNFVEGSYSAATRPSGTFTASSGSGAFAISTSSSNPIFGSNSLLLTKSSGASRQGRAIERTINLDSGYRGKVLKTRIDYTIVSGSFVAGTSSTDSSLIWYVAQFNGTTWSMTEPSNFKMYSSSTTLPDYVEGDVQVNSDTTQIKLIAYVAETANSAWVVKCEVGFKPSTYVSGTTITAPQSYTPSNTQGFGSITAVDLKWSQRGDTLTLSGGFTSGTVTGSIAQLSLPNGLVIGGTTGKRYHVGELVRAGGTRVTVFAIQGNNYLTFGGGASSQGDVVGSSLVGSSEVLLLSASDIPIQGWAATSQQSDGYDGRQIVFDATSGTSFTATTGGTWTKITGLTSAIDKVAGFASNTYTVKSAGLYKIEASVSLNSSTTGLKLVAIYKNGTQVNNVIAPQSTSYGQISIFKTLELAANDTIEIYYQNYAATETWNIQAYSITKLSGSPTISATERVSAILSLPSGQALGSATTDTVLYSLKEEDTHGAYNTSTGEFTCPYSGRYDIALLMTCSARSSAAFDLTGYVYVNGVEKASLNNYSGVNTVLHNFPINLNTSVLCNAGDKITIRGRAGYSGESLVANSAKNRVSIIKAK